MVGAEEAYSIIIFPEQGGTEDTAADNTLLGVQSGVFCYPWHGYVMPSHSESELCPESANCVECLLQHIDLYCSVVV